MKRQVALLVCTLVLIFGLVGCNFPNCAIKGKVYKSHNKLPISGAIVTSNGWERTTSFFGKYRSPFLYRGTTHTLHVSAHGYKPTSRTVYINDRTVNANFYLEQDPEALNLEGEDYLIP